MVSANRLCGSKPRRYGSDRGTKYIYQGCANMEKNRIRPVKSGRTFRMSYSKSNEVLEIPNLIAIQKDSYQWFLGDGLLEVFDDISPIVDFSGNLELRFGKFRLCPDEIKHTIEECKERDATYSAPLKVEVRLHNKETDTIKDMRFLLVIFR